MQSVYTYSYGYSVKGSGVCGYIQEGMDECRVMMRQVRDIPQGLVEDEKGLLGFYVSSLYVVLIYQ